MGEILLLDENEFKFNVLEKQRFLKGGRYEAEDFWILVTTLDLWI